MAKITLLPLYALLITFSLIWNHGNATTPRKLGVRHNTVTNLPNSMKLGKRQNPIIITSLPNTNEAANSGEPGLRSSPISSTSTQTDATTHFYRPSTDTDETTTSKIKGRFSSSQMWQSLQFEATPRKLGARHNTVTSLSTPRKLGARHNAITSFPNTYKATSRGSIMDILLLKATTPRIQGHALLQAFQLQIKQLLHVENPSIFQSLAQAQQQFLAYKGHANVATNSNKLGARENPIIITRLPSPNEATNSRESVLHFPSISSSPTQANRLFPRSR
ncbi:hypothetical protein RND71_010962 [Anisodus tanguticus]|uniref:Uncharacterized protein n=1 Tax=Anisodus tanguticus TaxID=243964 RepID=A0AAE1SKI9_9SOLA|nr:hypothetical protein RND71_010962 [Anisodus tanguticus]